MDKFGGIVVAVLLLAGYVYTSNQPVPVAQVPSSLSAQTTLVYFGTKDCGACAQFNNSGAKKVAKSARKHGYKFVKRDIASLRSLHRDGAFGQYDGIYKAAADKAGYAVPTFALLKNKELVAAKVGNWPAIMARAERMAAN